MKVLFTTLFVVIFDQVTKFLVKGGVIPLLNIKVDGMTYGQSINVFGDFFKITFVENPGLAFGIDVNETSKLILSIFTFLASIGIFYYLYKSRNQRFAVRVALALILGGAIGNLIDRTFYGLFYNYAPIFYGKVVDFFNVDFFDFTIFGRTYDRWPIFNIADSAVSIGVVLLLIFHRTETKEDVEKTLADNNSATPSIDSVPIKNETSENSELVSINSPINNGENSNREENSN